MAKGPKTKPDAPGASAKKPKAADAAEPGHNKLSDADLQALTIQWKGKFERARAAKKKADADFKNVCKQAKAELGKDAVADIKDMIAFDDKAGEVAVRNEIARQAKVMRWAGLPLGAQLELQLAEPDRTPSVDRAFDEGKRASMENKPAKPEYAPETEQYRSYMAGYQEDQDRRAGTIGRGKTEEAQTAH